MKEQQKAAIFSAEITKAEKRWSNVSFAKLSQIAKHFFSLGINREREYLFNSENTLGAEITKYENLHCFKPDNIDEWNAFLERFKVGTKVKIFFIENDEQHYTCGDCVFLNEHTLMCERPSGDGNRKPHKGVGACYDHFKHK